MNDGSFKELDQIPSLEECKQLIKNFPLFCLLTEKGIHDLASYVNIQQVAINEVIVKENDIVDKFYIIQSGSAQVTKEIATIQKTEIMPIAILTVGDSIGLTDTGFFSQTGIRKGTVTAITSMTLLTIDIKTFNDFLLRTDANYPFLKNIGEKILFMQCLKESKLFQHLSNEKIRQITHQVEYILINEGEILFNENDPAEAFYFLMNGKIKFFSTQGDTIHELTSPALFGEAALINEGIRNASAQAVTPSDILIIKKESIDLVIKKDTALNDSIMLSRLEQIRPLPNDYIIANQSTVEQEFTILFNPKNNKKMSLDKDEYAIWKMLDGNTILINIHKNLPTFPLKKLYYFIKEMKIAGFITYSEIPQETSASNLKKLLNWIKKLWK